MTAGKKRIRRSKEQSQRHILEVAERLLVEGGPAAINVRAVAAAAGITDAGVNHHFGSRDQLLEALLRHGGRRLRSDMTSAIEGWRSGGVSIEKLVDAICDLYAETRYAELALALYQSGWRDKDDSILLPVVEALHDMRCKAFKLAKRPAPTLLDTKLAVAVLHQALALDPVFGLEFRRSASISEHEELSQSDRKAWWYKSFKAILLNTDDLTA